MAIIKNAWIDINVLDIEQNVYVYLYTHIHLYM